MLVFVRSPQGFDQFAQGGIASALAIQPLRLLGSGLHECEGKTGFLVRGGMELIEMALQMRCDANNVH